MALEWSVCYKQGITSFQSNEFEEALSHLNAAVQMTPDAYSIYDSRAAVYDKLGRPKEALRDAKKAIDLARNRWQGYARSGRILLKLTKYDQAIIMFDLALARIKPEAGDKYAEISLLKEEAMQCRDRVLVSLKRQANHLGNLPVEVFTNILQDVTSCSQSSLVLLASVCKHWRLTILKSPILWDTLVLTQRQLSRKAKLWIERSNGRIRKLLIRASAEEHRTWSVQALDGIDWKALQICQLEGPSLLEHLHRTSSSSILNYLDELQIIQTPFSQASNTRWDTLLECQQSNMSSLTLDGLPFDFNSLTGVENLVSFTALSQPNVTSCDDVLTFIELHPKLEKIAISCKRAMSPLVMEHPNTHLPSLLHLELGGCRTLCALATAIKAPNLRKLYLSSGADVDSVLTQLHLWEIPELTELSIHLSPMSATPLLALLPSIPRLQFLKLSHTTGVAKKVLEALAECSVESPLCPQLTRLDFSHCEDVQAGAIVRLVKRRLAVSPPVGDEEAGVENPTQPRSGLCPIGEFKLDNCPNIDADALPWLRLKVPNFSCAYVKKKEWRRLR